MKPEIKQLADEAKRAIYQTADEVQAAMLRLTELAQNTTDEEEQYYLSEVITGLGRRYTSLKGSTGS